MSGYTKRQATDLSPAEKKLLKKILLLLVFLSLAALIFLPGRGLLSYVQAKRELQKIEEQKAAIIAQNKAYRTEIEKMKTDDSYVEKVAREEYGLQKPNEIIFDFKKK